MMAPGVRSAVMLLRRSTDRQEKSILQQRQEIPKWADAQGIAVVGEYVDDAISGDDHERRDAFNRLMVDLEKPDRSWRLILTYDRARHTRADIFEAASYADRILKAGADVVYCVEGKSLSTDHEMVWAIETFQKHEVLKQTSRDTLRGMLALARKGYWCGGPIPYGFDAEIVEKGSEEPVRRIRTVRRAHRQPGGPQDAAIHHILDVKGEFVREVRSSTENFFPLKSDGELTRLVQGDPRRVEAVKFIFDAMANRNMGFKAIARELNSRKIPPPGGWGLWCASAVKAIVHNPIYHGVLEWNSRTEAKYTFVQDGNMVPKPRSAKGQVFEHEEQDRIRFDLPDLAIVTPELWHRAHHARVQRQDTNYRQREGLQTRSILGGLVYCGDCGARMYGHQVTAKKLVGGETRTYRQTHYVCSTYLTRGSNQCSYNRIDRASLERCILGKIREILAPLLDSPAVRQNVRARLQAMFGGSRNTSTRSHQKRVAELRKQLGVLERLEARERETIGMAATYHDMHEELARLSKHAEPGSTEALVNIDLLTDQVMQCLASLKEFEQLPPLKQKAFFAKFVDRIDLKFERVVRRKRQRSEFKSGVVELYTLFGKGDGSLRLGNSGGASCRQKERVAALRGSRHHPRQRRQHARPRKLLAPFSLFENPKIAASRAARGGGPLPLSIPFALGPHPHLMTRPSRDPPLRFGRGVGQFVSERRSIGGFMDGPRPPGDPRPEAPQRSGIARGSDGTLCVQETAGTAVSCTLVRRSSPPKGAKAEGFAALTQPKAPSSENSVPMRRIRL